MPKARATSSESAEIIPKSKPKKAENVSNEGSEVEDGEEEEEYEIEEILDARKGYFPGGKMGYYVRWKNYGPEEDSWVNEDDAGRVTFSSFIRSLSDQFIRNADALVAEFWAKQKKGKRAEHSPKTKSRKSNAAETSVSTKKRGRKSTNTAASSDADVEMEEPRSTKKSKRSAADRREASTPGMDEDAVFIDMSKYKDLESWEDMIYSIDTIEREDDSTLYVYFRLTTGERVKEQSAVCRQYCPQKLITFYEANLRWKAASDREDS